MSNYKGITRKDVSKYATEIEKLSKELKARLDNGGDIFSVSSALVLNTSTLVFTLGELYHAEQTGTKTVSVTPVGKTATATKRVVNYYNKRDASGRFTV